MTDPTNPSDQRAAAIEALARDAAAGDQEALDQLLARIQSDVLRRCGRFLPNRADAEEAAQDALLRVAQGISGFQGRARFTTWLWQVTSNAALDTYRRLKTETVSATDVDVVEPRTTSVIVGTRVDLLEALESLKPDFARAVILRDVCDLSYAEIATHLDIPVGTVRSRIHHAREVLQARMRG
jgi:RNA polymerase sigma-70 factor (ECF subfamily)